VKKEIKPKELKRVAKKPATGEVNKSLPSGKAEARVLQDMRSQAAYNNESLSDTYARYKTFYDDQMAKANALDKGNPSQVEATRARIQKNPNIYADEILYDIPGKILKNESKRIAGKVQKQLKKK